MSFALANAALCFACQYELSKGVAGDIAVMQRLKRQRLEKFIAENELRGVSKFVAKMFGGYPAESAVEASKAQLAAMQAGDKP